MKDAPERARLLRIQKFLDKSPLKIGEIVTPPERITEDNVPDYYIILKALLNMKAHETLNFKPQYRVDCAKALDTIICDMRLGSSFKFSNLADGIIIRRIKD